MQTSSLTFIGMHVHISVPTGNNSNNEQSMGCDIQLAVQLYKQDDL